MSRIFKAYSLSKFQISNTVPLTIVSISQLSSVAQSCLTLCDPMDCMQKTGFTVHHWLPELTQPHVHRVGGLGAFDIQTNIESVCCTLETSVTCQLYCNEIFKNMNLLSPWCMVNIISPDLFILYLEVCTFWLPSPISLNPPSVHQSISLCLCVFLFFSFHIRLHGIYSSPSDLFHLA